MKNFLMFIVLMLFGISLAAQTPIIVPAKARTKAAGKTFLNKQGYTLSAALPDTTMVYQGSKGGLYVWKKSKKTGNNYKYYLPKTPPMQ